ncbi:MAG: sugar diacid recognition domain-containing protein [Eubacteriales bacterium]|nr:sugar diacid recognition domain-containing protein [Eubacteriales bacterium]
MICRQRGKAKGMDNILAGKLIEKISNFTDYNVNIMDENGILVASRMQERVGTFHDAAFEIVRGNKDLVMVEMDNPEKGVKAGVNMAVYRNRQKVGVVGVTGKPKEVLPIAKIIKMSVEVMMEYEMYKFENLRKYNLREQLMHLIFYNDNPEREELSKYFKALNLKEELLRIPVLVAADGLSGHQEQLRSLLSQSPYRSGQELYDVTREGFLLIYIAIDCGMRDMMQNYKYLVGEYLSPILRYIRQQGLTCNLYVGAIQNDIMYYRQAYLYCLWMQKNLAGKPVGHSYYFYDCIVRYMESQVSVTAFNGIFLNLKKGLGEKFISNYIETMGAIIEMDYNLVKASALLHVHKNTLVYRFDKIREVLNMNPLVYNTDREFMESFYYYLNRK